MLDSGRSVRSAKVVFGYGARLEIIEDIDVLFRLMRMMSIIE